MVILYMLALVFLLFQNADDARLLLKVQQLSSLQPCSRILSALRQPIFRCLSGSRLSCSTVYESLHNRMSKTAIQAAQHLVGSCFAC